MRVVKHLSNWHSSKQPLSYQCLSNWKIFQPDIHPTRQLFTPNICPSWHFAQPRCLSNKIIHSTWPFSNKTFVQQDICRTRHLPYQNVFWKISSQNKYTCTKIAWHIFETHTIQKPTAKTYIGRTNAIFMIFLDKCLGWQMLCWTNV